MDQKGKKMGAGQSEKPATLSKFDMATEPTATKKPIFSTQTRQSDATRVAVAQTPSKPPVGLRLTPLKRTESSQATPPAPPASMATSTAKGNVASRVAAFSTTPAQAAKDPASVIEVGAVSEGRKKFESKLHGYELSIAEMEEGGFDFTPNNPGYQQYLLQHNENPFSIQLTGVTFSDAEKYLLRSPNTANRKAVVLDQIYRDSEKDLRSLLIMSGSHKALTDNFIRQLLDGDTNLDSIAKLKGTGINPALSYVALSILRDKVESGIIAGKPNSVASLILRNELNLIVAQLTYVVKNSSNIQAVTQSNQIPLTSFLDRPLQTYQRALDESLSYPQLVWNAQKEKSGNAVWDANTQSATGGGMNFALLRPARQRFSSIVLKGDKKREIENIVFATWQSVALSSFEKVFLPILMGFTPKNLASVKLDGDTGAGKTWLIGIIEKYYGQQLSITNIDLNSSTTKIAELKDMEGAVDGSKGKIVKTVIIDELFFQGEAFLKDAGIDLSGKAPDELFAAIEDAKEKFTKDLARKGVLVIVSGASENPDLYKIAASRNGRKLEAAYNQAISAQDALLDPELSEPTRKSLETSLDAYERDIQSRWQKMLHKDYTEKRMRSKRDFAAKKIQEAIERNAFKKPAEKSDISKYQNLENSLSNAGTSTLYVTPDISAKKFNEEDFKTISGKANCIIVTPYFIDEGKATQRLGYKIWYKEGTKITKAEVAASDVAKQCLDIESTHPGLSRVVVYDNTTFAGGDTGTLALGIKKMVIQGNLEKWEQTNTKRTISAEKSLDDYVQIIGRDRDDDKSELEITIISDVDKKDFLEIAKHNTKKQDEMRLAAYLKNKTGAKQHAASDDLTTNQAALEIALKILDGKYRLGAERRAELVEAEKAAEEEAHQAKLKALEAQAAEAKALFETEQLTAANEAKRREAEKIDATRRALEEEKARAKLQEIADLRRKIEEEQARTLALVEKEAKEREEERQKTEREKAKAAKEAEALLDSLKTIVTQIKSKITPIERLIDDHTALSSEIASLNKNLTSSSLSTIDTTQLSDSKSKLERLINGDENSAEESESKTTLEEVQTLEQNINQELTLLKSADTSKKIRKIISDNTELLETVKKIQTELEAGLQNGAETLQDFKRQVDANTKLLDASKRKAFEEEQARREAARKAQETQEIAIKAKAIEASIQDTREKLGKSKDALKRSDDLFLRMQNLAEFFAEYRTPIDQKELLEEEKTLTLLQTALTERKNGFEREIQDSEHSLDALVVRISSAKNLATLDKIIVKLTAQSRKADLLPDTINQSLSGIEDQITLLDSAKHNIERELATLDADLDQEAILAKQARELAALKQSSQEALAITAKQRSVNGDLKAVKLKAISAQSSLDLQDLNLDNLEHVEQRLSLTLAKLAKLQEQGEDLDQDSPHNQEVKALRIECSDLNSRLETIKTRLDIIPSPLSLTTIARLEEIGTEIKDHASNLDSIINKTRDLSEKINSLHQTVLQEENESYTKLLEAERAKEEALIMGQFGVDHTTQIKSDAEILRERDAHSRQKSSENTAALAKLIKARQTLHQNHNLVSEEFSSLQEMHAQMLKLDETLKAQIRQYEVDVDDDDKETEVQKIAAIVAKYEAAQANIKEKLAEVTDFLQAKVPSEHEARKAATTKALSLNDNLKLVSEQIRDLQQSVVQEIEDAKATQIEKEDELEILTRQEPVKATPSAKGARKPAQAVVTTPAKAVIDAPKEEEDPALDLDEPEADADLAAPLIINPAARPTTAAARTTLTQAMFVAAEALFHTNDPRAKKIEQGFIDWSTGKGRPTSEAGLLVGGANTVFSGFASACNKLNLYTQHLQNSGVTDPEKLQEALLAYVWDKDRIAEKSDNSLLKLDPKLKILKRDMILNDAEKSAFLTMALAVQNPGIRAENLKEKYTTMAKDRKGTYLKPKTREAGSDLDAAIKSSLAAFSDDNKLGVRRISDWITDVETRQLEVNKVLEEQKILPQSPGTNIASRPSSAKAKAGVEAHPLGNLKDLGITVH